MVKSQTLRVVPLLFAALGACANAKEQGDPDGGGGGGDGQGSADAGCGDLCDADHDGVVDSADQCPNSSSLVTVNDEGCAESQLPWTLQPFPPFGLQWTPSGDPGRAGGLTWTYVNIERGDLFRIDWLICDDPATPCGISLDGPIETSERWFFNLSDTDLAGGRLSFTNSTRIALEDGSTPARAGRLTVTIVDGANVPIPFATIATLGVTPRDATYGAEITGTAFTVNVLTEIQDPISLTWTPSTDYYDAAPTPMTGGGVTSSFGGSFYAK